MTLIIENEIMSRTILVASQIFYVLHATMQIVKCVCLEQEGNLTREKPNLIILIHSNKLMVRIFLVALQITKKSTQMLKLESIF